MIQFEEILHTISLLMPPELIRDDLLDSCPGATKEGLLDPVPGARDRLLQGVTWGTRESLPGILMGSPDSLLQGVTWGTRESLLAGAGPGTSDSLLEPGGTRLTLLACTLGLVDTWTVNVNTMLTNPPIPYTLWSCVPISCLVRRFQPGEGPSWDGTGHFFSRPVSSCRVTSNCQDVYFLHFIPFVPYLDL